MGQYSDFQDLIDLVAEEPGWIVQAGHGHGAYKIIPPDRSKEVLHVTRATDSRQLENIRCRLRRAGFKPLMREPVNKTNGKSEPGTAATPPSAPRDLIAEARGHINQALEALSSLDRVLGEISTDQESVSKIKQLLQAVMK